MERTDEKEVAEDKEKGRFHRRTRIEVRRVLLLSCRAVGREVAMALSELFGGSVDITDELVQDVFRKLDANKDGKVSLEEFYDLFEYVDTIIDEVMGETSEKALIRS